MESVNLIGAEQVQHAAGMIRSAAEEMKKSAAEMSYAFQQHERFLNDWLQQFRDILMAGPGGLQPPIDPIGQGGKPGEPPAGGASG